MSESALKLCGGRHAIEFTTKVEKGLKIKLPKEHPELVDQFVRVIVFSERK